jgi:serine/threonine-protein kinase
MTGALCPRCKTVNPSGRLSLCPRCFLGSALEPEEESPAIPGLEIDAELGRGGMGRVFSARHAALGRDVAVKLLSLEVAADATFRARFEREARTLARLDHPGIVRVHDFGTTADGEPYLVMEMVKGGTLAERLPLPTGHAIETALELCSALAHAHEAGVVHRDIKPANVLVGDDRRVKLTDFGIARMLAQPGSNLTETSIVFGTPSYMSPEARSGAKPDPRMDVFSLGVMLHEMTTGKLPLDDSSLVPRALAAIIARATALDPERRTATVQKLARELEAVRLGRGDEDALPPEDATWVFAVAILLSVATAVAIYALVASFTPRIIPDSEALPLVAFGAERLADGRVFTLARFEVWPMLGAALAGALALAAYGLLLGHFRRAGLDIAEPNRKLDGTRRVFNFGVFVLALGFVREGLVKAGAPIIASYMPVIGGVLEFIMLHRFWTAVLEARRKRRPLVKEPLLWIGLVLALLPPLYHFFLEVIALRR